MLHVRYVTGTGPRREEGVEAGLSFALVHVFTAHWYGTTVSAVPWNSRLGASPESIVPPLRISAPESDTAPPTAAGGSSLELNPTFSAVIAPADEPPIAMRVDVDAVERRVRTQEADGGLRVVACFADRDDAGRGRPRLRSSRRDSRR